MTNLYLPPDPPSLSPTLQIHYNSLDLNNQRLFNKMYKYLWGVAHCRRFVDRGGVLFSFWAVLLRIKYGLTSSELSLITFIYQMTNRGANFIHSDNIYNSGVLPDVLKTAKQNYLSILVRRGYLSRSYRGSGSTYLSRSFSSRPVYIKLSYSGVALIEGIEKDLNRLLLNTSLDELTGTNKKL